MIDLAAFADAFPPSLSVVFNSHSPFSFLQSFFIRE
jgi:hypothetical protein